MRWTSRRSLLPALITAGLAATVATPARAHCGDECWAPLPLVISPTHRHIAADGVLLLNVSFGRAAAALEFFTVKVLDAEANEVATSPVAPRWPWSSRCSACAGDVHSKVAM